MAMQKMTGGKKPVAKVVVKAKPKTAVKNATDKSYRKVESKRLTKSNTMSTGRAKTATKTRGSKTAKQMGDMNEREGYNMYARSERSTSATKINAERRAKSGPGGKKNIKPEKAVGYRYGDHPPQGASMSGSTGDRQGTSNYYVFSTKRDTRANGVVSDRVNDYVSKRRAGGGKNLSPFEGAAKASSKGVANKPKGSLKSAKAKPRVAPKPKRPGSRGR